MGPLPTGTRSIPEAMGVKNPEALDAQRREGDITIE